MPLTNLPPLAPGTRLLHIGPQKTGSTAIQVAMRDARPELAEHGVHYSTGKRHRPDKAGWAFGLAGRPANEERPQMRAWEEFVRDVTDAGDMRVCVSNEDFSRATPEQVAGLVEALGGDRVHIVSVVRRLDSYLPSQWQERIKAGKTMTYESWLRDVLDRDSAEASWERRNVWFTQDTADLVERWLPVVGPGRYTLVVADEGDRDQLPRVFDQLLDLPAGTVRPNPTRSNRGLSWAETEMIRAINELGEQRGWEPAHRRRFVRFGVLPDMIEKPAPPGPKVPPMPAWALDDVRRTSEERVRQIDDLGVRVVGDPHGLLVPDQSPVADGSAPDLPTDVVAAAVAAVVQVAIEAEQEHQVTAKTSDRSHRRLLPRWKRHA